MFYTLFGQSNGRNPMMRRDHRVFRVATSRMIRKGGALTVVDQEIFRMVERQAELWNGSTPIKLF
jgi:hypothetical protein